MLNLFIIVIIWMITVMCCLTSVLIRFMLLTDMIMRTMKSWAMISRTVISWAVMMRTVIMMSMIMWTMVTWTTIMWRMMSWSMMMRTMSICHWCFCTNNNCILCSQYWASIFIRKMFMLNRIRNQLFTKRTSF